MLGILTFFVYHLINHVFSIQGERLLHKITESLWITAKLFVFKNLRDSSILYGFP